MDHRPVVALDRDLSHADAFHHDAQQLLSGGVVLDRARTIWRPPTSTIDTR